VKVVFDFLYNKIRLFFVKDKESYLIFYRMLGFYPKRLSYYKVALRHKSYKNRKGVTLNNERLEFLGDAVLDSIVADIVFKHFKLLPEGKLTTIRSKIVQRESLGKLAEKIGIPPLLKHSQPILSHNTFIYGNAFEALIGAIYLDQGYYKCKEFFQTRIMDKYIDLDKLAHEDINFKSRLLEWGQKRKVNVEFVLLNQQLEKRNEYAFESEVLLENMPAGKGMGYSKKESQQKAAKAALELLKKNRAFHEEVLQKAEDHLVKTENAAPEASETSETPESTEADA